MNDFTAHQMDKTYKIITIIGLVFEVISVIFLTIMTVLINSYKSWFSYNSEIMTFEDYELMIVMFDTIKIVLIVLLLIVSSFVILNLILFSKLIRGKVSETTAHKIYLYQAIYGGINLLSNQVVGVLYLVSGIYGYKGFKEERDVRPGI